MCRIQIDWAQGGRLRLHAIVQRCECLPQLYTYEMCVCVPSVVAYLVLEANRRLNVLRKAPSVD